MTGIVVIRAPGVMRVIHRAVLSFVLVHPNEVGKLQWMHLGDHLLQGFDVDVSADDDDQTDYAKVAAEFFETITSERFCTQNVTWAWDSEKKAWSYNLASFELHLGADLDESAIGYGSLGR